VISNALDAMATTSERRLGVVVRGVASAASRQVEFEVRTPALA